MIPSKYSDGSTVGWLSGLFSGVTWGLDTALLRYVLLIVPFLADPVLAVGGYFLCCLIHELVGVVSLGSALGIMGRLGRFRRVLFSREGLFIMLGGVIGGPFAITCYVFALADGGVALTSGVTAAYPLVGTVLAVLFLNERMKSRSWLGIMLAGLGIFYLSYTPDMLNDRSTMLGTLFALGTAVGWSAEGICCSYGMRSGRIDHRTATLIREIASTVVYLIVTPFLLGGLGNLSDAVGQIAERPEAWGLLLGTALVGMVSYFLWYKSIRSLGAARALCLNVTYSFWSVLFGALIYSAPMSGYDYFGAILVFTGVCVATIYKPSKAFIKDLSPLKQ